MHQRIRGRRDRCAGVIESGLLLACLLAAPGAGAAELTVIADHAIYPEGPVWRDGSLFYVEYGGAAIKRWDGVGVTDFWKDAHCGPAGLIRYRGNHLLVACYDSNTLVEIDGLGRAIRIIDRDARRRPFTGPNDFAADASGGIYFSASGVYELTAPITGSVLYLAPDGRVTEMAGTIHYSNGLTVSADGKTLLVAEDLAGRILEFPIRADHTLGVRRVWARLQDLAPPTPGADAYNGPDGLKLGPDGNYYIAQNGSGRVLVVGIDRKLLQIIDVPTPYVTNLSFGADGAHTLFITGVFDPWKAPYPGVVYRWSP